MNESNQFDFPTISFKNFGSLTIEEQQKMKKELLAMFESRDRAVQKFAQNMFIYSYIKDSLGFSKTSYAQLFPSQVRSNFSD